MGAVGVNLTSVVLINLQSTLIDALGLDEEAHHPEGVLVLVLVVLQDELEVIVDVVLSVTGVP